MINEQRKRYELGPHVSEFVSREVLTKSVLLLGKNPNRLTATIQAAHENDKPIFLGFDKPGVRDVGLALNPGQIYKIDLDNWYGGAVFGTSYSQDGLIVYTMET